LKVYQAKFPNGWLYIKTNLTGGYNLENALAAVSVGNYFGVDPLRICEAIEMYKPTNNRSQFVKTAYNQVLMDAYNANPVSMDAALENLKTFNEPLKGVILGDMFELGEISHEEHQKIADKLAGMKLSIVLLAGEEFSKCQVPSYFHLFESNALLISFIKDIHPRGYLFLVKGSRKMKLEDVVDML
jgi:UDP-N-acetylmuramoyl-tripeptide--D-alanyl-D-alanine ligase